MYIAPQHNPVWMTFNISLAMIPVFLGWFMLESKKKWAKILLGFFWFIFLPNSIYLFADITHLFPQWPTVNLLGKGLLLLEYAIVLSSGLLTYIYSLYPFEKIISRFKGLRNKKLITLILVDINFLVGLAIVLGRIQRINSWDILTNVPKVIKSMLEIFSSLHLVTIAILLGLFANFLYFLLRGPVMKYTFRVFKTS